MTDNCNNLNRHCLLTVSKDMPGLGESWDIYVAHKGDNKFAWWTVGEDDDKAEMEPISTGSAESIAQDLSENAIDHETQLAEAVAELADSRSEFLPLAHAVSKRYRGLNTLINTPVCDLSDGDFQNLAGYLNSFSNSIGELNDDFYPCSTPPEFLDRLNTIEMLHLIIWGDQEDFVLGGFLDIRLLWDSKYNAGVLYSGDWDRTYQILNKINSLNDAVIREEVKRYLLNATPLDADHPIDSISPDREPFDVVIPNLDHPLDSYMWHPKSFDIGNDCLTDEWLESIIRQVYDQDEGGYVREECPTPELWLDAYYSNLKGK